MIIKLIGYRVSGSGCNVYGVEEEPIDDRYGVGNKTFSAYFSKCDGLAFEIGQWYEVQMRLSEFKGEWKAYPCGLIPVSN